MTDRPDHISVSDGLDVLGIANRVHLSFSLRSEAGFLTQSLLTSPITARKLAAALQTVADYLDEAKAAPEAVMDFDAERAAIEAEYDETHP